MDYKIKASFSIFKYIDICLTYVKKQFFIFQLIIGKTETHINLKKKGLLQPFYFFESHHVDNPAGQWFFRISLIQIEIDSQCL